MLSAIVLAYMKCFMAYLNLFILHRAGNLVVPNLSTEVSDVTSSSGPVKLADLQRILNNLSGGPLGTILHL